MTWVALGRDAEAEESLQAFLAYEPWLDGASAYVEAFRRGSVRSFLLDPSTAQFGNGEGAVYSIEQPTDEVPQFGDIEVLTDGS
jgi:hypothetical protein